MRNEENVVRKAVDATWLGEDAKKGWMNYVNANMVRKGWSNDRTEVMTNRTVWKNVDEDVAPTPK